MGKKKSGATGGLVQQIAELDRQIEKAKGAELDWFKKEKAEMKAAADEVKRVKATRHRLRQDKLRLVEKRNALAKKLEDAGRQREQVVAAAPAEGAGDPEVAGE